jgi:predicted ATPase
MPVLTRLFPDVQFIVATHAQPVVSSLPDARVFDLRRDGRAARLG